MAKPVTIQLKNPFSIGSQTFTEITINPMKSKYLSSCTRAVEDKIPWTLELAGFMSGETEEMIGELEGEDIWEVVSVVSVFIAGSQQAGDEP